MVHKSWDINEHVTGRFKDGKPIIGATFQNGLNDIEPDGSFVPCDVGISEVTQGVTHLKMNRGRMGELRFGDSSHSNSFLVKIKNKALKGVSFKYIGAEGESMTANNGKPLCHFGNGISIESTPYYKGVKMDIVVNDPLTAPLEYPFSVKTYGQDYNFIEENGGATLRGEDQEPIFIQPPYAVDANGDIGHVTIHYTGIVNNLITFKKVVDEAWFRQAAAPVRIDPNVTIDDDSGTISDMFMSSLASNLDNNYGASTIGAAHRNAENNQGVGWLKVNLSAYSGISVTTAYWGLDIYTATNNPDVYGYNCLRDIIEGTKVGATASAGEPSWNDYTAPTAWASGGGRGSGTDRAATEDNNQIVAVNNDVHFTVSNSLVESWIDDFNYGELFDVHVLFQQALWRSSETGVGNKPYFYMEWTGVAAAFIPFFFDGGHY